MLTNLCFGFVILRFLLPHLESSLEELSLINKLLLDFGISHVPKSVCIIRCF